MFSHLLQSKNIPSYPHLLSSPAIYSTSLLLLLIRKFPTNLRSLFPPMPHLNNFYLYRISDDHDAHPSLSLDLQVAPDLPVRLPAVPRKRAAASNSLQIAQANSPHITPLSRSGEFPPYYRHACRCDRCTCRSDCSAGRNKVQ